MSLGLRQTPSARVVVTAALVLALAPPTVSSAGVEWSPIHGELTLRTMAYPEDSELEDRNHFLEGELLARITGRLSSRWQLTLTPLLQADDSDKTASELRLLEDQPERPLATFEELQVTYYGEEVELAFGKQLFRWGVGNVLSPTDALNAIDFLDVPTARKLGVPAASMYRYGSKIDVHLVLLPAFVPHRLPGLDNRWANPAPGLVELFREIYGVDPEIELDRALPPNTLDNLRGGLRLSSSSLAQGWDLELSLFRGFDPYGVFALEIEAPRVLATALFPEFWQLGGAFSTARGPFVFHGELAYHETVRREEDDDYYQYLAGLTYTLDRHIPPALDKILFGVEYLGEAVARERETGTLIVPSGFNRVFTNSLFARTDFVFSETTTLELGGGKNFDGGDYTARLQLTHTFADSLRLQTGIDWFGGDPETFFGGWTENDRFFLFATYIF